MSSYFPVHLYSSHFFFNFDVLKVTVLLPNVVKKKKLFFPGNKNFEEKRNRTVKNTLRKFIRKYNANFSCSKREKEIARLLSKRNNRIRNHLSRARGSDHSHRCRLTTIISVLLSNVVTLRSRNRGEIACMHAGCGGGGGLKRERQDDERVVADNGTRGGEPTRESTLRIPRVLSVRLYSDCVPFMNT